MTLNICDQAVSDSGISQKDLTKLTDLAKSAALQGGEVLMNYYRKINTINNKGLEGDLVTNADIEAENLIVSLLNNKTPEFGIFAEEGGVSGPTDSYVWCIDPLDGTTNYAHGYPFFACSIGLTWNNKPMLGAISIPFIKELYWATPGQGSFCNDQKIEVSTSKVLNESLLVTGFAYDRHSTEDNNYAEFCWLTHRTRGVRRGGAAAVDMAFVASGRIDGYWERGLSKWDIAAGIPLVELAGGLISDYKSNEFDLDRGRILASNPYIQKELLSELKKVSPLETKFFGG
ncbi:MULTISPECIES: inositol monophosphatase family protein [Prochlorococcus]|uniref:Inositol-1-monophosphatase n=1 Tax=Prochlorococcus marinus (strain SARG / CCMP1375 / SS120) TaxID=167539 RepID=Q7VC05_PROMA|nr:MULTISPECIES: inositol monophosphatase family protein [Prochlorococcus]AAP99981.1 inositol monophosphatase family [Prochlorococcus marinus subsp. marinus str. CCMP1375]KGG13779.1 Inositol-1-monophosphatasee [Prochlorococcus marinus str. LG]KGG18914.1 Inositol-1-monophosphatasee [Prochlorococcus marinus str. SS2]KGG23548.1 Inositol-1-monophosphatasee [Prochlorococcus marinus str. SS35]KGG32216.1 Inositol-1-monophosphatasee [Prochlorococcus marinus str. SS51]